MSFSLPLCITQNCIRFGGMKTLIILLPLFLILSCTPNSEFEGEWRKANGNENVEIGRVLIKNNVKGCGQYYVKGKAGDFIVACYDGANWNYFEVLTTGDGIIQDPNLICPECLTEPDVAKL